MSSTESPNNHNIGSPIDKNLPFFAYGFFKKGELAYNLIKNSVDGEPVEDRVRGELYNKDGIPIFVEKFRSPYSIGGNVIRFATAKGYEQVRSIEPGDLYKWDVITTMGGEEVNILVAKSAEPAGAELYEESSEIDWSSRHDRLFKDGMEHLYNNYFNPIVNKEWQRGKSMQHKFFELQMGYVFLWTIVDRYCSFKYSLSAKNLGDKYRQFAKDKIFYSCYRRIPPEVRVGLISSSTDVTMDESDNRRGAQKLMDNLYTMRNNAVHRGKALDMDFVKLEKGFLNLYSIMHKVFSEEFTGKPDLNIFEELKKYNG